MMRRLAGLGYRHALAGFIAARAARAAPVGCLEITAEHFFGAPRHLAELARAYPLFVHGLGLSLGTPGPLDPRTLEDFARVVDAANPRWISEHIAFTRTAEVDLGHLNPVRPSRETLQTLCRNVKELAARCPRPVILENITSHLSLDGEMKETEFLNRLCEEAPCGLLLDVTNLHINSRNHGFDARAWLRQIKPRWIVQLHVVGYARKNGRCEDTHAEPIQDELLDLIREVLEYAPVQAVILERDENLERVDEIEADLQKLEALCAGT